MILIPKYKNVIEIGGSLSLVLTDEDGNLKQELYVPNLVVTKGKEFIASRMAGTSQTVMSYMGIGLTATSEVVGDDTLKGELTVGAGYTGYARQAVTTTVTGTQVKYVANFPAQTPSAPSTGAALREAGIFNDVTAGTMLCRTTFPTVTKLPADALTITWTVTVS